MATIVDAAGRQTVPTRPPRLATPEPLDVPRWTDDEVDYNLALDQLGQMLGSMGQQTTSEPSVSMGLPKLGLGLAKRGDWLAAAQTTQAPQPEPTPTASSGRGGYSGVGGANAYGYSGRTGVAGTKGTGMLGLNQRFSDNLSRMNAAMKAAGLGTFGITDGWRSYEAQVDVKKRKPGLAATPGTSIHGIGLAADLKVTAAQSRWIQQNGARYGVYLPMPSKEPWHVQAIPSSLR